MQWNVLYFEKRNENTHFPNEVFFVYVYNCTSAFNFASDLNTYFLKPYNFERFRPSKST